jgi:hypothetical protein
MLRRALCAEASRTGCPETFRKDRSELAEGVTDHLLESN